MPSRKRAKGKARKAKATENNCNLILHNDSVCRHGCEIISKDDVCYKFVELLEVEMKNTANDITLSRRQGSNNTFSIADEIIERLLRSLNKRPWGRLLRYEYDENEETKQKLQRLLLNLGTNILLRDEELRLGMASTVAMVMLSIPYDFDLMKALVVQSARTALRDLNDGVHYDIIKFFNKRTPCICLEKLTFQERPMPRKARCDYCKTEKERSQLYLCSACLYFYYCSEDCQAAAWSAHQRKCDVLRGRRRLEGWR